MYCPDCGTYADSNFCPYCGKDLRNVVLKKAPTASPKQNSSTYSVYMQYYPDKLEAIRRLRIDTGMSLADAKQIIDSLFYSDDNMPRSNISNIKKTSNIDRDAVKHTAKKAAKTAGIAASAGLLAGLKVIFDVAKKYK